MGGGWLRKRGKTTNRDLSNSQMAQQPLANAWFHNTPCKIPTTRLESALSEPVELWSKPGSVSRASGS